MSPCTRSGVGRNKQFLVLEDFLNESVWPSLSNPGAVAFRPWSPHRRHSRLFPRLRSPVSIPNHSGCSSLGACAKPCHSCRCGHPLDIFGRHQASCAEAGVLGRRGLALEVAAQVCREGGGRVSTNVMLGIQTLHNLKWMAEDCCGWFAKLLRRPTRNQHHHGVPSPQGRRASTPGVTLRRARRRKEQTHPELHGAGGRSRLVVLAAEVGRRWSNEAAQFLGELAAFKASTALEILRERVRGAWLRPDVLRHSCRASVGR